MAMELQPWAEYPWSTRKGDKGNAVGVLQLNLNLSVDGVFGKETQQAVEAWQDTYHLEVDGIAGPATMQSIVVQLSRPAGQELELPAGYLKSIAFNESNFILHAAKPHGSDDAGWDVGAYMRSSGTEFPLTPWVRSAFDVYESAYWTARNARNVRERLDRPVQSQYMADLAPNKPSKFRWQLAVLSHNWPGNWDTGYGGAIGICRTGQATSNDDEPPANGWIAKATDGAITTPRQWCMNYIAKATAYTRWNKKEE